MRKYFTKFKKLFYLFLTIQLLLAGFPLSSFAYPTYIANSDLVIVGPYDTPASTGISWGANATNLTREFLTYGQKYRIRQNGSINRVYLYTNNVTGLTGFYIKIWRKVGATYNLIGTSDNIAGSLQAGSFNTVDLATPITGVQEGDHIGYRVEGDQNNFYAKNGLTGVTTYYVGNTIPSSTEYDWESQTAAAGFAMPINVYMQAPQVVFIGDSIVAGHPGHYSFLETTATTNIESTMEKQFSNLTGYSYQNMGVGSQVTTNIAARFTADVINLHPQIVVIEGGINDISFGGANKDIFLANWTTMLNAAQADASIQTIAVLKILPWTNGSTVQMQAHDDWNASLATLASGYSKAIVVDANSYVGQFRVGGDAGNLWNNQAQYSPDGTHFNQAGHLQIAQAIVDNLPKPSATFDNDFSTWNTGNITANYNLIQTGGSTNSNISQTGSSGIEYSTDGSTWNDATQGSGGDGLTGLTSTASPGTNHSFIWDSATDLLTTEDSTIYLRIRPNDGTTSATDWVTSNAFGFDNVAPSSVGVPTFGTITSSSIEIIKPDSVTEGGALNQWQARRNSTTELGLNATTTTSVIDSSLSENTQYTYDAQFNDGAGNTSIYGTTAQKYTLADTPTNLSASLNSNNITLTVDSLPNDTSGQSGYYFSRSGANSGWIQTNSWTDTGLSCGNSYTYSVKYRNGDGTETSEISTTKSTSGCGGGGGSPAMWTLPTVPAGGFKININGGALTTSNRNVFLGFNAGTDITKVSISMTGDFTDASQENYVASKQWDLCSKFGGAVKNPTCLDGTYKVYAQFYTAYGRTTGNAFASSTIVLKSSTTPTENLQQTNNLPFTNPFTKYLQYRQSNADIKRLQIFLNSDPDTKIAVSGAGSSGKETNYFGPLTYRAVIKFQEKYAKDILAPWGFVKGTGYVGKTTIAKINELMKNK